MGFNSAFKGLMKRNLSRNYYARIVY